MGSEWRESTLGEFCPFAYGKGLPEKKRKGTGTIQVFGSNGVVGTHDLAYVDDAGIIIGRKGTVGAVHYSDSPFWPIDTTFYIENEPEKRDLRFTYYLLQSIGLDIMNSDSAVPGLNRDAAHRRAVKVPDISEQKIISNILGTLDDKIELNREMNETLESMAQALFKSWFVDFDPVIDKALAAGNPIPDELSEKAESRKQLGDKRKPLPKDIASLFPDEFEESKLGWIPKGWKVGVVSDLGEIVTGKTPPTKNPDNYGTDIPFITIPDMHGKVFVTETGKYLSYQGAKTQSTKFLPPKSICVSCIATPGLVAINSKESQTNQQINSVIPVDTKSSYYCFMVLRMLGDQIRGSGSGGSVFPNMNKTQFSKIPILLSKQKVIGAYQNLVAPLYDKLLLNESESQSLVILRDTLLPKLISGELRVPDAENLVEEAGR